MQTQVGDQGLCVGGHCATAQSCESLRFAAEINVFGDGQVRYERQLQLYAYMLYESRGRWPIKAYVVYPLTVSQHEVKIDPEECIKVAQYYRNLIDDFKGKKNHYELASPGEVCQVCDYRPWCLPFWNWQGNQENLTEALENAYQGYSRTKA